MEATALTAGNACYRSTNHRVISAGTDRVLVDLGWPGTLAQMHTQLSRMDAPTAGALLCDSHPLTHRSRRPQPGAEAYANPAPHHRWQLPRVDQMQRLTKPGNDYLPILTADSIVPDLTEAENRLRHLRIPATVLHTLGHLDDNVSDPLDDGGVFTGNLPNPDYAAPERTDLVATSS